MIIFEKHKNNHMETQVVTGAFGYSGKYITQRLLDRKLVHLFVKDWIKVIFNGQLKCQIYWIDNKDLKITR